MFKKIAKFIKEVRIELKKVAWPDKDTIITSTAVVLVTMLFLAIFLGVEDRILNFIIRNLFQIF
jgi:preprotein translocase subunit SecE